MTNKEKFKEIFGIEPDCGHCTPYPCEENDCKYWAECENQPGCPCDNWWDWEFKEPKAKDVPGNNAGEILNKLRAKMEEISSNMNPEDEWDYGYKAGVEDLIQFLNQDLIEPKAESEEENGNEAV